MKEVTLNIAVTADVAVLWWDDRLYLRPATAAAARGVHRVRRRCHYRRGDPCDGGSGALAIGIAAAYGVVLAARQRFAQDGRAGGTRWRMICRCWPGRAQRQSTCSGDRAHARVAFNADRDESGSGLAGRGAGYPSTRPCDNRRMGDYGASLIAGPTAVITHCNTGGLATGDGAPPWALSAAHAQGKIDTVYADETRPGCRVQD